MVMMVVSHLILLIEKLMVSLETQLYMSLEWEGARPGMEGVVFRMGKAFPLKFVFRMGRGLTWYEGGCLWIGEGLYLHICF